MYGFNIDGVDAVAERIGVLTRLCGQSGRDIGQLRLAVALQATDPADVPALAALGVGELVLVEAPPESLEAAADWVAGLARRYGIPACT